MDQQTPPSDQKPRKAERGGLMGGLILIVLGLLFLANNFIPDFSFHQYWPVILIVIGAVLLWNARTRP
jgi:hypothetical protein